MFVTIYKIIYYTFNCYVKSIDTKKYALQLFMEAIGYNNNVFNSSWLEFIGHLYREGCLEFSE